MRIISYNINGLNAFNKNGKLTQLINDYPADIYCLQEVKADYKKCINIFESNNDLNSYSFFGCYSDKKGYAGVGFLIKNNINIKQTFTHNISYIDEQGEESIYTSGRIIVVEFDTFYLINVYVVNSGNKQKIRDYFDKEFKKYLQSFDKPFIVCGDFNVCGTEYDYWGNYVRSINSAPGLYMFEINNFRNMLSELNLIDTFRLKHGDERKYSWFSPLDKHSIEKQHGWRIDYFLINNELTPHVKECDIIEGYQGRDHSPIILDIDL